MSNPHILCYPHTFIEQLTDELTPQTIDRKRNEVK